MSSEAELVVSVWEIVRDVIPYAKRGDVAKDLVCAFVDFGFEAGELASIVDEDPDLSEAFDEAFEPSDFVEDEIDE